MADPRYPALIGRGTTQEGVAAASPAWLRMQGRWQPITDLCGGTTHMRQVGKTWLPQENREAAQAYEARLKRSYLYGAFTDTIQKLAAKPFARPVTVSGGLQEQLGAIGANADLEGRDLTHLARSVFSDALKYGLSHVLVDFPSNGGGLTLAEERATGQRPYFVQISPLDLFAWKVGRGADGSNRVTEIRFKERRTEYGEGFLEDEAQYIRVINEEGYELWRESQNGGEWAKIEEGPHSFGRVPLVTYYSQRTEFMEATPPLEDLAWLNIAHWQSLSDQRNILRFARVGILFMSGVTEEELEAGVTIGPSQMISSTNPDARLSYVEHTGRAIQAGEADLAALEKRMEVLGLSPLVERTGGTTATGRAMDEARTSTNIQAWIRALEDTLAQAYGIASEWIGASLPDDFAIDIFNDFGIGVKASEDTKNLITMGQSGLISHETLLQEIKRRGILSDEVDVEAEAEQAKTEADTALLSPPPAEEVEAGE